MKKQGGDDEFLFVGKKSGEPLSEASFKRMWVRLMKAMVERAPDIDGIYCMKKVEAVEGGKAVKKLEKVKIMSVMTPHYFRHNFATALYWANVRELQACAWMGHADVTMINKIYGHLRITDSGNEVQKMADYIKQRISCVNDVPKQLTK